MVPIEDSALMVLKTCPFRIAPLFLDAFLDAGTSFLEAALLVNPSEPTSIVRFIL
jgi:hypothetical protein